MALHLTPEAHDADPPESWRVEKHGRRWALVNSKGHKLESFATKREAQAAKSSGFHFRLYQDEGRWFRGEPVRGWKPYDAATAAARAALAESYAKAEG